MRLFTGLSLPPTAVASAEAILEELRPTADVRWSPPSNLHITLAFIGSWDEARLTELRRALERVEQPEPIPITISGFGYFPNPHRPHTFFLGVRRENSLAELVRRVEECLTPLGWSGEDREYTPHITLARIARENITQLRLQTASMNNLFPLETYLATEFHLYESRPGKGGSVYTKIATFPFGAKNR